MYVPALPAGGLLGWRLLERTEDAQRAAFAADAQVSRLSTYFAENVAAADTAEKLVADRQLLEVALTAFGLQDDLNKQAFIRQVLDSDPLDAESFANRLVDQRYRDLMNAFNYQGLTGPKIAQSDFAANIVADYQAQGFELAVGNSDEDMRLALNFRRAIADYAVEESGDDGVTREVSWLRILGDPPMRAVLEAALGLPSETASIALDQQTDAFRDKARDVLGGDAMADLASDDGVETLIRRFLLRQQIEAGPGPGVPGFAALSLLQSSSAGSGALLASSF